MCQYLFAAFSLKQSIEEGLSDAELEAVTCQRRVVSTLRRRRCCIWRWCTTCCQRSRRRISLARTFRRRLTITRRV